MICKLGYLKSPAPCFDSDEVTSGLSMPRFYLHRRYTFIRVSTSFEHPSLILISFTVYQAIRMAATDTQRFVGAWRLISVETRDEKGEMIRRGHRTGYLLYSGEGHMSVAFMREGRPTFASGDIRGGTVEEKTAAVDGYVSYSGRFGIKGDIVVHHIEVSLFPNWVGVSQERLYEFIGDRLTLSTPLMLVGGRQLSTHVIWERAS